MDKSFIWGKETSNEGRIFVNEAFTYMISHDLRVMSCSVMNGCSLLTELQIEDASILEERVIDFDREEVLNLFQRPLTSKNALTEVIYPDACMETSLDFYSCLINEEMTLNKTEPEIMLNLLLNNENDNVLYAEVGEDFVNYFLSFLTFPLGSVLRFLPDTISLGGCINNLYKSVEIISVNYFKTVNCRNMLLTPKFSTFHGFKCPILKIEEITSKQMTLSNSCMKCYSVNGSKNLKSDQCMHGISKTEIIQQNPRSKEGSTNACEALMVSSSKFVVADNLSVSPLSVISVISFGMNLPFSDWVTIEVCMDKHKARLLFWAMLVSKTVSTDVFNTEIERWQKFNAEIERGQK